MKATQGAWKKLVQQHAEKMAERTARAVWLAYWRKYDARRRLAKRQVA